MAINWFEGGRRIRNLLFGLVALGGAAYVLPVGSPTVYFATQTPDAPWQFLAGDCRYPSRARHVGDYTFRPGDNRNVALCFQTNAAGNIAVGALALPPEIEADVPKPYVWDRPYSIRTDAYIEQRTSEFIMTRELEAAAGDGLNKLTWNLRWQNLQEAMPWVFGLILGLHMLATVMGWIIRGFAGIPAGSDFRPAKPKT